MNLEALQLRRAEEQVQAFHWVEEPQPRRRKLALVKRKGGTAPSCLCGECRKCRNREAMRERRAASPKPPPKKRGWRMSDVLCAVCRTNRIAVKNKTGICTECHRHRARRVGHVAQRSYMFSHGGGI